MMPSESSYPTSIEDYRKGFEKAMRLAAEILSREGAFGEALSELVSDHLAEALEELLPPRGE